MPIARQPLPAPTAGLWTVLASMIGLAFGPSVIAVLTISLYIPSIEQEFGWSRVQVSLAFTIVAYLIVVVAPIQGLLVDRFGPRRVILTSIPLFASSLSALYFTPPQLTPYYVLWGLVPIFGLGLWPLSYLQAVTPWFDRRLGFALGCANAGIGLGSTLLPVLVIGPAINAYGWRHAMLVLAALILFVSWPVVWFGLRESSAADVEERRRDPATSFGLLFADAAREPTFAILNIAFFLLGLTATSLVSQQVPLLRDANWTAAETTQLQTVFGMGLLFARIGVGFLIDHVFAPRVMMAAAGGGALACLLYAWYPEVGAAAYAAALLVGVLLGAEFDVLAFLIKRYYGTLAYGRIYGVIFAVFYLGSGLGITGLAWIREASAARDYTNGLYAAALVLSGSAILLAALPRYRFPAGASASAAQEPTPAAGRG